jgi:hypothetical protein
MELRMQSIRTLLSVALLALTAGAAHAVAPTAEAPIVTRPAMAEPASHLQGPLVVQRVPSGCSRGICR